MSAIILDQRRARCNTCSSSRFNWRRLIFLLPRHTRQHHQRTLWERTHSHSSQSLSLFIDVCVRRKQSVTVFLSPSLNLHLSTYLSMFLSVSSLSILSHSQSAPCRYFFLSPPHLSPFWSPSDSCASACVPKKTKFAAVAPSALSAPRVWRLSIFQGLVGDCVWERILRGEGERRNHYIYMSKDIIYHDIYIYIYIYIYILYIYIYIYIDII